MKTKRSSETARQLRNFRAGQIHSRVEVGTLRRYTLALRLIFEHWPMSYRLNNGRI